MVQQCNSAFNHNYFSGGNLNTYVAAAPNCVTGTGQPIVPNLSDVSRNLQNPKYVQWNFEIQHTIRANTLLSANYVGNRGYDELYYNAYLNSFGFGALPATVPDPRVGRVNFLNSGAHSNYNGITLSVQERALHGLSGSFSYTYSHALDEVSNGGVLPFSVITSLLPPQSGQIDPTNLRSNYASADYDARHSLTASYVYQLPFKSNRRALNALIGGWQVSGTMFWHTGFPFSAFDGATIGGLTATNNLGGGIIVLQPEFAKRDFSKGDAHACILSPCFGWAGNPGLALSPVNPTAPFQFAATTNNFINGVGRNGFRGPSFLGGDASVRKSFKFTERMNLQIGLNAYNFLNHANYGVPYPSTAAPFFGSTLFTQTPPTSPYGAFAAAATDMRMAQVMAKFEF
jgi:hypothetical protein